MAFDTLQKSRVITKILTFIGLLNNEMLHKRFPSILPIYYKSIIHVPLTFSLTILMWLQVLSSEDFIQATDVLYIALTETALVVKIISIWYHDSLVKSLFNEWQQNEMFKLQTTQEHVMWQSTMKLFGIVSFLYIMCSLSVVGCAFIAVLFLSRYQLPFAYWTFFNWQDPVKYWYAYGYELFSIPLTCLSNCSLDMLYCYMMQHLTLCFKVMAMRLEQLGSTRKGDETNKSINKKLLALIRFHLKTKSMSRDCEAIVSYPISAQILLSALVLCFSLYRFQKFDVLADPINFLSLVLYAVVMILQIFLPCYYANKLTFESSALLKSTYNSNWIEMSPYNRKIILLFMQYLQEPVFLKAGNFFNIGLPIFSKTMNNAYSFFALLLNMDM